MGALSREYCRGYRSTSRAFEQQLYFCHPVGERRIPFRIAVYRAQGSAKLILRFLKKHTFLLHEIYKLLKALLS